MRAGAAFVLLFCIGVGQAKYLGKEVGPLSELHHGVRGRLYAVDSRTVYLQDFHYDGAGPAAYFYVGTSATPSATGALRLRDDRGGTAPLRRFRGESVTLSLPDGKTLKDFAWFSVWCDDYSVNFGSVEIPRGLEFPKPAKVGALRGVHGVSSDPVVVVDAQTLLIPNFSYDGEAPDAKFWVGRGEKPSPQGIRIPDENGKETPLRKYDKKTVVLTLPGELTVFDIGHFAVWCEAFTVNFGHVVLPHSALTNVPPSLKMLGVSPQSRNMALSEAPKTPTRSRKPLTRLDATTYRPTRLGAGPPATIDQPAPHAHLRRRDDRYTPPRYQLIPNDPKKDQPTIQQSLDITYQPSQEFLDSSSKENVGVSKGQENPNNEHLQSQGSPNPQSSQQTLSHPVDKETQELLYQQQIYEQRKESGVLNNQKNPEPNYEHLHSQELLKQSQQLSLSHPIDKETQELLYQQQIYEQQRLALQQELQHYRGQYQPEPLQYRLVPYNYQHSHGESKLNCEVLQDDMAFEVRWAIAGDSIVLQLVAKLEDGEYMSFGLSGSPEHSQMVGGDVAVAWVDKATLKGFAEDYYLDAKSQCAGSHGSCPDEVLAENTNSIRLLNAALVNGYSIVTYQRALRAADSLDLPVLTNASQPVIWAIGPLNSKQEVSYHHHYTKGDKFIEFGRPPLWNCPMPEGEEETREPEPFKKQEEPAPAKEPIVSGREKAVATREQSVGTREENFANREQTLATREHTLATREQNVGNRERHAPACRKNNGNRRRTVATREEIVAKLEQNVTAREQDAAVREQNVADREKAIAAREQAITACEQDIASRDQYVGTRELSIYTRELSVATREQTLTTREQTLTTRENTLTTREQTVVGREQVVAIREHSVSTCEQTKADRELTVENREKAVAIRQKTLEVREQTIATREQIVADREKSVSEREEEVDSCE